MLTASGNLRREADVLRSEIDGFPVAHTRRLIAQTISHRETPRLRGAFSFRAAAWVVC